MKRFKGPKGTFCLFLIVVIILVVYYSISSRGKKQGEETAEVTAVQNVLLRNLERNYPQTPKEVVKYYSEITKCFYNEEYTDEELVELAMKAKALYGDELAVTKHSGCVVNHYSHKRNKCCTINPFWMLLGIH